MPDATTKTTLPSNVPPPPTEVKVRTMQSDIEGIAKAGGGSPQFRTVAVEGLGLPKDGAGNAAITNSKKMISEPSTGFPWWLIIIVVIAFGVLIFFGYTLFLKK